jgi:hypothetical protein
VRPVGAASSLASICPPPPLTHIWPMAMMVCKSRAEYTVTISEDLDPHDALCEFVCEVALWSVGCCVMATLTALNLNITARGLAFQAHNAL